jgi:hypothetical protein
MHAMEKGPEICKELSVQSSNYTFSLLLDDLSVFVWFILSAIMNSTRAFRFINNQEIRCSSHFASLLVSVSLSILFRVIGNHESSEGPQVQKQASKPISR